MAKVSGAGEKNIIAFASAKSTQELVGTRSQGDGGMARFILDGSLLAAAWNGKDATAGRRHARTKLLLRWQWQVLPRAARRRGKGVRLLVCVLGPEHGGRVWSCWTKDAMRLLYVWSTTARQ